MESSDDREVEDGDCLGVSLGEAEMEFEVDEGEESMVMVRSSAARRGLAVDDMVKVPSVGGWRKQRSRRGLEEVVEGQLMLPETGSTNVIIEHPCRFTQHSLETGLEWNISRAERARSFHSRGLIPFQWWIKVSQTAIECFWEGLRWMVGGGGRIKKGVKGMVRQNVEAAYGTRPI